MLKEYAGNLKIWSAFAAATQDRRR
jgi:hypothetical protein